MFINHDHMISRYVYLIMFSLNLYTTHFHIDLIPVPTINVLVATLYEMK